MSDAPFCIASLATQHSRNGFDCGIPALNRYFQEQVTQDVRRRIAACFVALDAAQRVAGFYTLAAASVALTALPASLGKKLPRYPSVPTVRLGRLAVDKDFAGMGLGGALLADAIVRIRTADIAAWPVMVEAKDEQAKAFYLHHGFLPLPESGLTLFLPL